MPFVKSSTTPVAFTAAQTIINHELSFIPMSFFHGYLASFEDDMSSLRRPHQANSNGSTHRGRLGHREKDKHG
jgi:hypothetical protein